MKKLYRIGLVSMSAIVVLSVVGVGVLLAQDVLIHRDAETRKHVLDTEDVELPTDAGARLSLVVTKSSYRLDVLLDGERIKTYPVALGGSPTGDKRQVGDERTPEGEYYLIPHHESPNWGPSFYVAYPDAAHARRGIEDGLITPEQQEAILARLRQQNRPPADTRLGGHILIHTRWGTTSFLTRFNWTQGCIAMRNDDLRELLAAFSPRDRPTVKIY